MPQSEFKRTHTFLIGVILILAISIRFFDLAHQFTTDDDIGVAETILVQDELYQSDFIRGKIYDQDHEDYATPQYRLLRWLDQRGKLEGSVPTLKKIAKFIIVPQTWTYAPFQFIFTSLLLSPQFDYRTNLLLGRLPSFIFSVLALFLIVYLCLRLGGKNKFLLAIVSLLLLSFSLENIIYAKHMSSYAIGIFAAVLLLALLVELSKSEALTTKRAILGGVILAAAASMQYQVLLFIPAFFIYLGLHFGSRLTYDRTLVYNWHKAINLKALLLMSVIFIVLITPLILAFVLPQSNRATAIFIDTPYLFKSPTGVIEATKYAVLFFTQNTFAATRFITTFVPYETGYVNFITALLLFFAFLGLITLLRSAEKIQRRLGWFFLISIATITLLIILGKLPLSPTRHSLIYLPYFVFLAASGLIATTSSVSKKIKFDIHIITAFILAIILTSLFLIHIHRFIQVRRDPFNEPQFKQLIEQFKPQFVIAAPTNLSLMSPFKSWPKEFSGGHTFRLYRNPNVAAERVAMIVLQEPFTAEICEKINRAFRSLNFTCDSKNYQILYAYDFDNGAILDVSSEEKVYRNTLSIKVFQ